MSQSKEILKPRLPITHLLPEWCVSPQPKPLPNHAAILSVILAAKDAGNTRAECALAEIGLIMGKNYEFVRTSSLGAQSHQIVERP
jgi:hypothetical protein